MCSREQVSSPGEAIALLEKALDYLNGCDVAALPAATQADLLRGLERAESRHTAARARTLSAFAAQGGHEEDGQHSARAWLVWQTQVTGAAAASSVAWCRRLAGHAVIDQALATGQVSASWARQLCAWSDRLPVGTRHRADQILCAAATGGTSLADLARLAEEIYQRTSAPSTDDDGFDDRYVRLGITFRGAGRLEGDLTPGCSQALSAVLDALGRKAGPEDTRTAGQRRHDALEEACRRLIASGMLPARGGQPTQVQVHMSLGQLRGTPGAPATESAWAGGRATRPGWLTGPEADAAACDATIVPVVSGHVDWPSLDRLTDAFLAGHGPAPCGPADSSLAEHTPPEHAPPEHAPADPGPADPGPAPPGPAACGCTCHRCRCAAQVPLPPASRHRLRTSLLALATDALSGPGGLAARLRAGLGSAPLTSISLPLDIGAATETVPAHLRRAVMARHPYCAFPGCQRPARVCDIHHLLPRSQGGATKLGNLLPLCTFHHLVVIHRWGWTLRLNPDGTTTATSPDGRSLHSHGREPRTGETGPPGRAA